MTPLIIESIISAFFIKEGPKAKQVANEPLNSTICSGDSPLLPHNLLIEEPFYCLHLLLHGLEQRILIKGIESYKSFLVGRELPHPHRKKLCESIILKEMP